MKNATVHEAQVSAYVSPHLTWLELACHDVIRTPYPNNWRDRAVRLAAVFEAIRAVWQRPVVITSAYRTPAFQQLLIDRGYEASPRSWHVQGLALDLRPPEGVTAVTFGRRIHELATRELGDIGGIGISRTFVHVDLRPRANGSVTVWAYAAARPSDSGVKA